MAAAVDATSACPPVAHDSWFFGRVDHFVAGFDPPGKYRQRAQDVSARQ